jgi:hypothetical protein
MVRVVWKPSTGELVDVKPGDGPNQYSDGANPDAVHQKLVGVEQISEVTIAASVAGTYEGPLSSEETLVTTETYTDDGVRENSTTLAFVEISDLMEKLEYIDCNNCSYSPDSGGDWLSQERDGKDLEYTDWICPVCEKIVHTEAY